MTDKPLSARTQARYDMVLRTVNDIAASPRVAEFCVGITGKPSQRRSAYERWCRSKNAELHGFVMLDWEHAPDSIQRFEQWLFEHLYNHRKYANSRHVRYFPSVNRKFEVQYIYVAWWSPAFMR